MLREVAASVRVAWLMRPREVGSTSTSRSRRTNPVRIMRTSSQSHPCLKIVEPASCLQVRTSRARPSS